MVLQFRLESGIFNGDRSRKIFAFAATASGARNNACERKYAPPHNRPLKSTSPDKYTNYPMCEKGRSERMFRLAFRRRKLSCRKSSAPGFFGLFVCNADF
jgi:hypothetical protein